MRSSVGVVSALIYASISLVASGLFLAATLKGDYDWVTRLGGAGWVFLLSLIILMPVVTPMVKRRMQARE